MDRQRREQAAARRARIDRIVTERDRENVCLDIVQVEPDLYLQLDLLHRWERTFENRPGVAGNPAI